MTSDTPSQGDKSIAMYLRGFAIFVIAMAAGMGFSPASGRAADRGATSEKRIIVVANDPGGTTAPARASSADGLGAAGEANPDPAARPRAIDALKNAPLGF